MWVLRIYKLVRSNRRTVSLIITKDATLEVRAPLNVSLDIIRKFVADKKLWIEKKIKLANILRARKLPKFEIGEKFLYEGSAYKLQSCDCEDINIPDAITINLPRKFLPKIERYLINWYKTQAIKKIIDRVSYYANINQLKYSNIKLTNAKRRWGSCSNKGALNISWKLIMAPPNILDYVIVHELVHLVEKNHSKLFWDKVRVILPDYKERKNWLKKNGYILDIV